MRLGVICKCTALTAPTILLHCRRVVGGLSAIPIASGGNRGLAWALTIGGDRDWGRPGTRRGSYDRVRPRSGVTKDSRGLLRSGATAFGGDRRLVRTLTIGGDRGLARLLRSVLSAGRQRFRLTSRRPGLAQCSTVRPPLHDRGQALTCTHRTLSLIHI